LALTPAEFKTLKPQFSSVDDSVVQSYLDMSSLLVDDSWGAQQDIAQAAATCHLMTLDGLGDSRESGGFRSGMSEFQRIESGKLSLTRFSGDASSGLSYSSWLSRTFCGKFYLMLLRRRGGPLVLYGGGCFSSSRYAKDTCTPISYGWPGVFFP